MAVDTIRHPLRVGARRVRREFTAEKSIAFHKRKVFGVEPDLQEEGEGHATKDEESMKTNEHGRREDPSGGRSDYLNGGQSVLHAYAQPPSLPPEPPAAARPEPARAPPAEPPEEKKVN